MTESEYPVGVREVLIMDLATKDPKEVKEKLVEDFKRWIRNGCDPTNQYFRELASVKAVPKEPRTIFEQLYKEYVTQKAEDGDFEFVEKADRTRERLIKKHTRDVHNKLHETVPPKKRKAGKL